MSESSMEMWREKKWTTLHHIFWPTYTWYTWAWCIEYKHSGLNPIVSAPYLPQKSDIFLSSCKLHRISHCSLGTLLSQVFTPCHLPFPLNLLPPSFFPPSPPFFPPTFSSPVASPSTGHRAPTPSRVSSPLTHLFLSLSIIHFSSHNHHRPPDFHHLF